MFPAFLPAALHGQFSAPHIIANNIATDTTVSAVADFDSDGDPDVAIGTRVEAELKWLRNDGSGAFTLGRSLQDGVDVLQLEAADFDGDGDQDVVVITSAAADQVQVFKNIDGTGFFDEMPVQSTVGGAAQRMEARDVDGDGDMDLVLVQSTLQRVAWFANAGNGSYGTAQVLFSGAAYTAVAWGDVTGDGAPDVFASAANAISWRACVNAACGTVQALSSMPAAVVDLFVTDADADGDRDLFAATTGNVMLALNTTGNFSAPTQVASDGAAISQRRTAVYDADGDARADVFTVNGTELKQWTRQAGEYVIERTITLSMGVPTLMRPAQIVAGGVPELLLSFRERGRVCWLGSPAHPFAVSNIANTFHHALRRASPYPFDYDMDGDLDHLYGVVDAITVHRNEGGGSWSGPHYLIKGERSNAGMSVLGHGDVDGDGVAELLAFNNSYVILLRREVSGTWRKYQQFQGYTPTAALADMDDDGDLDLVAPNSANFCSWYRNEDGDLSTVAHTFYSANSGFSTMAMADIDGDDALDIVAVSSVSVIWKRNNGDGTFPTAVTLLLAGSGFEVTDMDGDGDLDVVILASSSVNWMRNEGNGTFTQQTTGITSGPNICADLDADGDTDIASILASSCRIYRNNGAGVLTLVSTLGVPASSLLGRYLVDVNADGFKDLVVTPQDSPTVFSYSPGSVSGTFTALLAGPYLRTPGAHVIVTTDVDQDGDEDILATLSVNHGSQPDGAGWWRNDGGSWTGPIIIDNASGYANTYRLLDVDLDGRTDILFNHSSGEVRWRRSLGGGVFASMATLAGLNNVGAPTAGELNGDGVPDMVLYSSPNINVQLGTGPAAYGPLQAVCTDCAGNNAAFSAIIDIDGDGDRDIGLSPGNRWLRNSGSAVFNAVPLGHGLPLVNDYGHDVDHDGHADVVSSTTAGGARWSSITISGETPWLPLRGIDGGPFTDLNGDGIDEVVRNGSLWVEDSIGWYSRSCDLSAALRGDLKADTDSDGADEFLLAGNNANLVAYEGSLPDYGPDIHAVHDPSGTTAISAEPLLMDSDGDGRKDLFISGFRDLRRYPGEGAGSFGEGVTIYRPPEGSRSLAQCDFDGDDRPDLVPMFQIQLSVLVNQGPSGWDPVHLWGPYDPWQGGGPLYTDMADMDGNGTPDVVFTALPNGGISPIQIIYRPNLGGVFGTSQVLYPGGTAITPGHQRLADMDSDGDPDLVFAVNNRILHVTNLGMGFFAAMDTLAVISTVNGILPADLDSDGKVDLVVHQPSGTTWMKNLGNWQLGPPQLFRPGAVATMLASDIDLDGDDDILFLGTNTIEVARNDGAGVLTMETLVNGGAHRAAVDDVDGDGDLDIMCVGIGTLSVYWYENFAGAPTKVLGRVFDDMDTDGLFAAGEPGHGGVAMRDGEDGAIAFTANDGRYVLPLPEGAHTVMVPDSATFPASTTGGWSREVVLTAAAPVALDQHFGVDPGPPNDTLIVALALTTGLPRCMQQSAVTLGVINLGNVPCSGTVSLTLDAAVVPGTFSPPPSTITGQIVTWEITDQPPGTALSFHGSVLMPASGQVAHSALFMATAPGIPAPMPFVAAASSIVICSFDPNSKRVSPLGEGPLGDIPRITESLTYTIDFQNLGTDTAFTVQLRDHLHPALDEASVRILGSSHVITGVAVESDRELVITFADIQLPDSATNPLGSMGHVTFSIDIVPGMPVGTIVTNEAAIYFDLNAPVITNETVNRLVDDYVALNVRAFLGGAYISAQQRMRDALRLSGLLPASEPYTSMDYVLEPPTEPRNNALWHRGGLDAVVDWVVVGLRSASSPGQVLALRAAMVLADGRIVGLDGQWPLVMPVAAGSYRVTVEHRNHLGVMTASGMALSPAPVAIDFTSTATVTYGSNAQSTLSGKRVLWAGDVTNDGIVKYTGPNNDRDPVLVAIGGNIPTNTLSNVYSTRDVNLDGVVRYVGTNNDRDPILQTVGGSVPTATRVQQLP